MPFLAPVGSGSSDSEDRNWWLIDSGASASVVSLRYAHRYPVLKTKALQNAKASDGFSSASGEVIMPISIVCLQAFFEMEDLETHKSQVQPCLINAFVADVPSNVLSVGSLLQKGWILGNEGPNLTVMKDNCRLKVCTWQNVPWILHHESAVPDVDRGLEEKHVDKFLMPPTKRSLSAEQFCPKPKLFISLSNRRPYRT